MSDKYILDERGRPVPEPDILAWARWYETADRTVALDELPGDVRVSTVFLGIDCNLFPRDPSMPPLIWELMVFGGEHDGHQERFFSRAEAAERHREVARRLREGLPPDEE